MSYWLVWPDWGYFRSSALFHLTFLYTDYLVRQLITSSEARQHARPIYIISSRPTALCSWHRIGRNRLRPDSAMPCFMQPVIREQFHRKGPLRDNACHFGALAFDISIVAFSTATPCSGRLFLYPVVVLALTRSTWKRGGVWMCKQDVISQERFWR